MSDAAIAVVVVGVVLVVACVCLTIVAVRTDRDLRWRGTGHRWRIERNGEDREHD